MRFSTSPATTRYGSRPDAKTRSTSATTTTTRSPKHRGRSMLFDDFLRYPKARYGMDHDRYQWSMPHTGGKVAWPNGAGGALWVTVSLQWFPLDQQGKP